MHTPSFTIKAFGAYIIGAGLSFFLVPNLPLRILGLPPAQDIWVQVLGLVATILGCYYMAAGIGNVRPFFVVTVYGRLAFCAGCAGLVFVLSAPWQVLIFGVIDAAGALWTFVALRSEPVAQSGSRGCLAPSPHTT